MSTNNSFADWHLDFLKMNRASVPWTDVEKQELCETSIDVPSSGVVCSWTFKLTWRGLFALVITFVAVMNLWTLHSSAGALNINSVKEKLMMSRSLIEDASFYWKTKLSKQEVPVYYINMKEGIQRRSYMENHLKSMDILAKRVEAFVPRDPRTRVNQQLISIQSQLSPNDNEIACIISHLIAIHDAVHDEEFFPDSPYAVIIEDDVHFEFKVDLQALISGAPQDFHVLQLMTSNDEQVVKMFYEYVLDAEFALLKHNETAPEEVIREEFDRHVYHKMWSRRESNLWSTQAYVVNKEAVRGVIDSIVSVDPIDGTYVINFKNSAENTKFCRQSNRECYRIYPHRLVADIYLYDVLGNTYASKLPMMNGGNIEGYQSSIQSHGDKEAAVNRAFSNIGKVIKDAKENGDWLLPSSVEMLPQDILQNSAESSK